MERGLATQLETLLVRYSGAICEHGCSVYRVNSRRDLLLKAQDRGSAGT